MGWYSPYPAPGVNGTRESTDLEIFHNGGDGSMQAPDQRRHAKRVYCCCCCTYVLRIDEYYTRRDN